MPTFQDVLNRIDTVERQYNLNWVRPLSNAYVGAHAAIEGVIRDQREREKARVELIMTAVSLGVGVGLGAMFAKTAAKAILKDQVANYAVRRGMTRTTSAITSVSVSKPLSFFVSRSYDEADDFLTDRTRTAVERMGREDLGLLSALESPQIFQNKLHSYLEEALVGIGLVANDLNVARLSAEREAVLAQGMLDSAVVRHAPTTKILPEDERGTEIVELAQYMLWVMNGDIYVETTYDAGAGGGTTAEPVRRAVDLPTGHAEYPKTFHRRRTYGSGYATRASGRTGSIEYRQPGRILTRRVDELHEKYFGGAFFVGRSGRDELLRAEALYGTIVDATGAAF